ncbi:MAG: signal recognition particle-docking protein FtsY, partial [Actinobacteria bacterium]|nr:signal recognition particle-docking protein FtsY [Actinomycetota bacterium]
MFWRKKPKADQPQDAVSEVIELPKRSLGKSIKSVFSRIKFDLEDLTVLEDVLIQSDFGVDAAADIVSELTSRAKRAAVSSESQLRALLAELLIEKLSRDDSSLNLSDETSPYVVLVVGVNGAGKTTTI